MLFWIELAALAAIGQFFVVAAGAAFAYMQLRGLRQEQEAEVVQNIFDKLNSVQLATALDFVYRELPKRLCEPSYILGIRDGTATVSTHTEMVVMHFFNELGLLVHEGLVSKLIVPFIASPCIRSWDRLVPVIELMRQRYPHAYTPFESLVVRARAVDLTRINDRFRLETPQKVRAGWDRTASELLEARIVLTEDVSVFQAAPLAGGHDNGCSRKQVIE